jgi:hypothetical protein
MILWITLSKRRVRRTKKIVNLLQVIDSKLSVRTNPTGLTFNEQTFINKVYL